MSLQNWRQGASRVYHKFSAETWLDVVQLKNLKLPGREKKVTFTGRHQDKQQPLQQLAPIFIASYSRDCWIPNQQLAGFRE
jgi:hypothetical protein